MSANQPAVTPPNDQASAKKVSFKETLNLPQTSFAMKADLVKNEAASLARWSSLNGGAGLYQSLRNRAKSQPKGRFTFHDGPPYANGSIHLGHLMNKCLKDFVVRTREMMGFDVPYVPGWDCHGLPIEHKVMTELAEKKELARLATMPSDGPSGSKMFIRKACQTYAASFVKLHTTQMSSLLTNADYAHPYLTMQPSFEGATLEVLAELMSKGLVYRALKPVHWSVDNQTALADAELEYHDRQDVSVYVDFEAADQHAVYAAFGLRSEASPNTDEVEINEGHPEPGDVPDQRPTFMIWTTTPWTLPANVAIAVNPEFEYALVWVDGNVTIMATNLVEKVCQLARSEEVTVLARTSGANLVGLKYRHPFVSPTAHESSKRFFEIVAAAYVTLEDGTGLVHTAPGHGTEDYQTGLSSNLPIYCPVQANGTYDKTVPQWLQGKFIWKANQEIVEHLRSSGHLFHDHTFMHSYPHDWRSKTPVIFRCTEQWFVCVDGQVTGAKLDLRSMSLASVDPTNPESVRFVPEWGRNRMRGMLESRPDWCISRQRAWGLPIPAFLYVDQSGMQRAFMTAASVRAIATLISEQGADIWFTAAPSELLKYYNPAADPDYPTALGALPIDFTKLTKGPDILDVWFESGSSWNSCMRQRGLGYPIDLYLEGSDQHRGWFQLSLLPALGVTGMPPFKTLLTHGFMVDKDGKKLSKSKGDTVEGLMTKHGADVLRWWVSSLAYENDVKVDESFFASAGESYRKVRNTLRFMLSNLYDFTPTIPADVANTSSATPKAGHCVDLKLLSPTSLEAWVLGEFDALATVVLRAYESYDFRTAHLALFDFCNNTLSSVYCMAIKDRLYCDKPDAPRRRQTQTVLFELTDGLCRLLAPILCHTADEAYRALWKVGEPGSVASADTCVHLKAFIRSFDVPRDARWPHIMQLRETALATMEQNKKNMGVENPLDLGVTLPGMFGEHKDLLEGFELMDLADLLNVSRVSLDNSRRDVQLADLRSAPICERSRRRDSSVKPRSKLGGIMLSDRDAAVLNAL